MPGTNFSFLTQEFAHLADTACKAEQYALTDPVYSAILCRKALEAWVKWLYDNDRDLALPADTGLASLMYEPTFAAIIPPALGRNLHLLRKTGNIAAHSASPVSQQEAVACVRTLFDLSLWAVRLYSRSLTPTAAFNQSLIPTGDAIKRSRKELEALRTQYEDTRQQLERANKALQHNEAALQALRARLEAVHATKQHNRDTAVGGPPLSLTEAETRRIYIDVLLKEAGWDVNAANVCEYPVTDQPAGYSGRADYVLWGENGLPLAVVEAKKTVADAQRGQRQAELYANALEQMHGRRPVIFYTNGFETFIWDDAAGYPPRQVAGFYSREELERLINRRGLRQPLSTAPVNKDIAGRYYQEEAIRRVAARLEGRSRGALLVMATGSGKTRTAAALVELLAKAAWAKRILFLADRNALVTQAKKAFNTHLPQLSAIDLTKEDDDGSNRIIFSTYPTMMHRIDGVKQQGRRYYGVGHFDVVIIDEAHRSIYQKYRALFHYFDALFIGLTATPKADGDKDTYELFGLEAHNPTYAYELDQAVFDKYLVPPKALAVPLRFPRQGIKYNELSEADKAVYEQDYMETYGDEVPDEVGSAAVNEWLFNTDTTNKVLDLLMQRGQKVAGGDRLGKTIVFARNHTHALFIEACFNNRYPQYGGKMLRVIDNQTYDVQGAIDAFSDETNHQFLIAVSVDMLDTGIDIPDVLNLVFFKPVRSKAKFWQMVGRGTRLRPDIFGPGADKAFFYIFDVCGNIAFFSAQVEEVEPPVQASITQQLFSIRLDIAYRLQQKALKTEAEAALEAELITALRQDVGSLSEEDFRVGLVLRCLHTYQQSAPWAALTQTDLADLHNQLAPLVAGNAADDEAARRFDLLSYRLILDGLGSGRRTAYYRDKLAAAAAGLLRRLTIPQVAVQAPLIRALQEEAYWSTAGPAAHDATRKSLRHLMQYVEATPKRNLYTSIEDVLESEVAEEEMLSGYTNLEAYRKRVEAFLRQNQHHLTIRRIRTAQPITGAELAELERLLYSIDGESNAADTLPRITGGQPLVVFIRSLLGMDVQAAKDAFSEFLATDRFNPTQIHFINTIINALCKNGLVERSMLFDPPFTNYSHDGLSGVFAEADARKVISIIDGLNESALQIA